MPANCTRSVMRMKLEDSLPEVDVGCEQKGDATGPSSSHVTRCSERICSPKKSPNHVELSALYIMSVARNAVEPQSPWIVQPKKTFSHGMDFLFMFN